MVKGEFASWQIRELACTQFRAAVAVHLSIGGELPSFVTDFANFLNSAQHWATEEPRMNRWEVEPMFPPTRPHPRRDFWGNTIE